MIFRVFEIIDGCTVAVTDPVTAWSRPLCIPSKDGIGVYDSAKTEPSPTTNYHQTPPNTTMHHHDHHHFAHHDHHHR